MRLTELTNIAKEIICSDDINEHVNAVIKLSDFYKSITTENEAFDLSYENEKYVIGGQALSTYHAAVCTDDYLRTAYFLKGIYKALNKLMADFPEKKINILYAGCGPFATLLLPLLPLLNKNSIEAIVLDINSSSIRSVNNLISIIGVEDYTITLIETDATTYRKPDGWDIDLFITETMHYGLTAEPQVSITKNFIPQLQSHSIIIPNQIHIDLVYTYFGKEPFIRFNQNPAETTKAQPQPERFRVSRLFSINKDSASLLAGNNRIVSDFYPVPEDFSDFPDMCVFTEIETYDDIRLKTAESVLTNPYCITSLHHLKGHPEFRLVYDYSETPGWTYNVKET